MSASDKREKVYDPLSDFKRDIMRDWYSRGFVLNEIMQQAWDRELCIDGCYHRDGFRFHERGLHITEKKFAKKYFQDPEYTVTDAFTSYCRYDCTPIIGRNLKEKKRFFGFNKPVAVRLAFDIDADAGSLETRIMAAWEQSVELVDYLKSALKCEVSVVFSGGKGFHVETNIEEPYEKFDKVRRFAKGCAKKFPYIDDKVYTARREWRVPYSVHGDSLLVVLPLDKEHFEMFGSNQAAALMRCRPNDVLNNITLHKRGLVTI